MLGFHDRCTIYRIIIAKLMKYYFYLVTDLVLCEILFSTYWVGYVDSHHFQAFSPPTD